MNLTGVATVAADGTPITSRPTPTLGRIDSMLIDNPDRLAAGLETALAKDVPFLLEIRTRGDRPMPRTSNRDMLRLLGGGNLLD